MTSRERLLATLNHEPVDRVCVDFGAGGQTGLGVGAVHALRQALLPDPAYRVKISEPYQMLGEVDEVLRQALKLDVKGVPGPGSMFGFDCDHYKPFTMPDGTPCLVPGKFNWTQEPDGAILMYPQGDTSVAPCAKMPTGSFFFDATKRQLPIDEAKLDPADNCEEFGPLSDEDVAFYAAQATRLYEDTEAGLYMTLPGTAFGDIALVPATWLKHPKGIRDVEEWYISTLTRPDYIHAVFDAQLEFALQHVERLVQAVGDRVQVVFVSGTDFGHQNGQFCSVATYRDLYKPYHKAVNDKIHEITNWKTFIHSCGAIYPLIPEFIDAGFDVLNPVQCSAKDMEPRRLKREFGKDVVFWGGGVDTQKTLPFGTPDEVYKEVRERIEIFFEDQTGFVFNAIHNIQSNVPVENLLAMFRAVDDAR